MIYKYNFSIAGDNFYPDTIIDKIQGSFLPDSWFKPGDKKFYNKHEDFEYGGMSFWHPKKFSTEDNVIEYEEAFIEFIEKNYSLFIENGVDDLQIYIEIYYDGVQCNFEIFSRLLLKKLAQFDVALPISVYALKEEKIEEWENEIRLSWQSD